MPTLSQHFYIHPSGELYYSGDIWEPPPKRWGAEGIGMPEQDLALWRSWERIDRALKDAGLSHIYVIAARDGGKRLGRIDVAALLTYQDLARLEGLGYSWFAIDKMFREAGLGQIFVVIEPEGNLFRVRVFDLETAIRAAQSLDSLLRRVR